MKRVILKILALMCISMLLVFGIFRTALYIIQLHQVQNAVLSYHISLLAGFWGLALFVTLLYFTVGRRLNKISRAVDSVSNGQLDTVIDIGGKDEIAQLAHNFNRMTKGLKANEYLSREFVRNVSHEFKTPVSAIKGYAQLLCSEGITEDERAQYSKIIVSQAEYLNKLSADLLKISRLDSNNIPSVPQPCRVDEQIRQVILSMQSVWQQKKLNMDIDLADVTVIANAEPYQLIWQNLISNAVKYTADGGNVSVRLTCDNDSLCFTVTNSDITLKGKEQLAFESFFTINADGKESGTGLGLPIVSKVVKLLQGSITLEITDSTRFKVVLPATFIN